jgi:hypothetical protein
MPNTVIIDKSIPEIGYYSRTAKQGSELNMVYQYIEYISNKKLSKNKLAVFVEPRLRSGFPDLVLVEYSDRNGNFKNRNDIGMKLTELDLKILFEIDRIKETTISNLISMLGYSESQLFSVIERLNAACLIKLRGEKVLKISKQEYSIVEKIISIEAKMDKWGEAINQAYINYWFASESYVLLNKNGCNESILKRCDDLGLGIILVNGKIEILKKSSEQKFPVSYSSLLFGEWLQRYLQLKEFNNGH